MPQSRAQEPSRHAARRHGADRRPRGAHEGHRPAQGRDRSRHGRPVQQQEPRQARHLAQRPPSQGPRDREAAGGHVRHRRGGLLSGRARQLGARLRDDARDQARHHLRAAIGHGRAGHLRALPHDRADRQLVCGAVGDVGSARTRHAGRLGLQLPRLDGSLQLFARHAERVVPSRAHG